jgi:heme a synthase
MSCRAAAPAGPWLHRFVVLLGLVTLALLGVGGLVTSRGVGMAVPDWPNTYGYNMFLFPLSKWLGGIFYEHSHRLVAALVGLLTTILAVWLWGRETRGKPRWIGITAIILVILLMGIRALPVYVTLAALAPVVAVVGVYHTARNPQSLRWLGMIALAGVILQGILGGLRVVWFKDEIGIFHATLAQLFFALICVLALRTSRWWQQTDDAIPKDPVSTTTSAASPVFRRLVLGTTFLILLQLVLGATMRHQHAGLAIPDFPLAYGKLWPATDPASIAQYNQHRIETIALNPITGAQIFLQLAHRLVALLICGGAALCAWLARRERGQSVLATMSLLWFGLILVQVLLGATTLWSNKAADIATAHVLVGALSLALGTIQCIICFRGLVLAQGFARAEALTPIPFAPHPSAAASLK